jgi:hypothetical protein
MGIEDKRCAIAHKNIRTQVYQVGAIQWGRLRPAKERAKEKNERRKCLHAGKLMDGYLNPELLGMLGLNIGQN